MNVSLSIPASEMQLFQRSLMNRFEEAKQPVQGAMGERFFEIVRSNFGDYGIDRPTEWAPLSDRSAIGRNYIRKVGRTHATLFVTGHLESSIKFESNEDSAKVSVSDNDCEYATDLQFGNPAKNLPARPYFPIEPNGEITPFTTDQVNEAASQELQRILS